MNVSPAGIAFTQKQESCTLTRYWDVDGWSIGWGHHPAQCPGTCTQDQADAWLEQDLARCADAVNALGLELTQPQFDALVDFAYNEGTHAFAEATFIERLRAGDAAGAAESFLWWDKAGGAVSDVLLARRKAEWAMGWGA